MGEERSYNGARTGARRRSRGQAKNGFMRGWWRIPDVHNSRVLKFQSSRIPEFRNSRVPEFRNSTVPQIPA
jgi:hypothetical protein